MADSASTSSSKMTPVQKWLGEIASAKKREKEYRKDGKRVLDIYRGSRKNQIPFNILYSNTETLMPALYNNTPRPEVDRRFKDADSLGKAAAAVGERSLSYLMDTNSDEYSDFDSVISDAVLDALLPGRGATRVRYDYEGSEDAVTYETACFESLKWDRYCFGSAKKWCKVPWLAFEYDITEEESKKLFGGGMTSKLKFQTPDPSDTSDSNEDDKGAKTDEEMLPTAKIWEIWDKAGGKKVRFLAECYKEEYLKVDDDPLELTGFYPIPKPLRLFKKSNDLLPVALYLLYENQARELNRITVRINKIVEALKVRGVYDSTLKDEITQLFQKDDNQMVGAENVAALQNGGLDKAIWLVPIDKLVTVLQQLILARQQCKQVIYEITGISDILRGASAASETLGAQEIKQQWATLRLKSMQKEVATYVRDLLRITLEIVGRKFSPQQLQAMTGLPYPFKAQKQQAQMELQQIQAVGQQLTQQAQASGQPPPEPPPEVQQKMQQAQQTLSMPTWEDIKGALSEDLERQYKIDIETNSTVDLEATEDQKGLADLMNAMSQFLNGVAPIVESGVMPFEAAKAMLLTLVRRYRFGSDVEDQIEKMQPPQPKPDPAAQVAEKKAESDIQIAQMKAKNDQESMQQEAEFKRQEHQLKMQELAAKVKYQELMGQLKMQEGQNKLVLAQQQGQMKLQNTAATNAINQEAAEVKAKQAAKEPSNADS